MSFFSGILNITFKYLLEFVSPIVGWCLIGTFINPWFWNSHGFSRNMIFQWLGFETSKRLRPRTKIWQSFFREAIRTDNPIFRQSHVVWLVVWLTFFIFPYIGLLIIPTDVHIFSEGWPNHQPACSVCSHDFWRMISHDYYPCDTIHFSAIWCVY